MLKLAEHIVKDAERLAAADASLEGVLRILRALDIDSFGELLNSMPDQRWPRLSALLPIASSEDMDRHLTGDTGTSLLQKTVRFVRSVDANFQRFAGRSLRGARICDYGYGYGRLSRMMLYFADPSRIYGCDVAQRSLDWATELRLPGIYGLIDEAPRNLPFGDVQFDLIYAFSVFTHLSETVASIAINTLVNALSPDGLLVLTVRPAEYWRNADRLTDPEKVALTVSHEQTGYAFSPHSQHFGDTSIAFEWLRRKFPELDVVGYDWGISDPAQIVVFLRPSWRFPKYGGA